MEATKRCPHCAEEILAAAIKCKHCKTEIAALPTGDADFPPHPESIAMRSPPVIVATYRRPTVAAYNPAVAAYNPAVADFNVRRAVAQVERGLFNRKCMTFVMGEVTMVAIAVGLHEHSWTHFLLTFAAGLAATFRADGRNLIGAVASLFWGFVAFNIMRALAPDEVSAWFLAALFAVVLSVGAHYAAFQYLEDYAK